MPDDAPAPPLSLHERDLALWAEGQARALAERRAAALDWDNLAEEIESLGRSERREIRSRLAVLLLHLLKWERQPERRKYGWRSTIMEQRSMIAESIADSPSLGAYPAQVLPWAWRVAVARASEEPGLPAEALPAECPYTLAQVLGFAFLPGPPGGPD
jgi:hypothetical protein